MYKHDTKRTRPFLALVSAFLSCLLLAGFSCGCERAAVNGEETAKDDGGEPTGGGDVGDGGGGTVEMTLYFRLDTPDGSWLAPEKRAVDGVEPCRAAMEALIAGPGPGSSLKPVLPGTVKVLDASLSGGVCTVNLSKEILTDSSEVGAGASSEMLALAAIADTLTELEGVEKVKLLVEGAQSGMVEGRFVEDFWGHVGLPEYLERNEEVIYKGG